MRTSGGEQPDRRSRLRQRDEGGADGAEAAPGVDIELLLRVARAVPQQSRPVTPAPLLQAAEPLEIEANVERSGGFPSHSGRVR